MVQETPKDEQKRRYADVEYVAGTSQGKSSWAVDAKLVFLESIRQDLAEQIQSPSNNSITVKKFTTDEKVAEIWTNCLDLEGPTYASWKRLHGQHDMPESQLSKNIIEDFRRNRSRIWRSGWNEKFSGHKTKPVQLSLNPIISKWVNQHFQKTETLTFWPGIQNY